MELFTAFLCQNMASGFLKMGNRRENSMEVIFNNLAYPCKSITSFAAYSITEELLIMAHIQREGNQASEVGNVEEFAGIF